MVPDFNVKIFKQTNHLLVLIIYLAFELTIYRIQTYCLMIQKLTSQFEYKHIII
jgi:hypothetical protein